MPCFQEFSSVSRSYGQHDDALLAASDGATAAALTSSCRFVLTGFAWWCWQGTDQVRDAGLCDSDGGVSADHELAQSQGARGE